MVHNAFAACTYIAITVTSYSVFLEEVGIDTTPCTSMPDGLTENLCARGGRGHPDARRCEGNSAGPGQSGEAVPRFPGASPSYRDTFPA